MGLGVGNVLLQRNITDRTSQGTCPPPTSESDTDLGPLTERLTAVEAFGEGRASRTVRSVGERGVADGCVCLEFGAGVISVLTSAFVFTAAEGGDQDECRGKFFKRTSLRTASLAVFLPHFSFTESCLPRELAETSAQT